MVNLTELLLLLLVLALAVIQIVSASDNASTRLHHWENFHDYYSPHQLPARNLFGSSDEALNPQSGVSVALDQASSQTFDAVILGHSSMCVDEREDIEILEELVTVAKRRLSVLRESGAEGLRGGGEVSDDFDSTDGASLIPDRESFSQTLPEMSSEVSSGAEGADGKEIVERDLPSHLEHVASIVARRRLSQNPSIHPPSTTSKEAAEHEDDEVDGVLLEELLEAADETSLPEKGDENKPPPVRRRRLSEIPVLEERRDRLLAILETAVNSADLTPATEHTSGSKTIVTATAYVELDTTYLAHLGLDLIRPQSTAQAQVIRDLAAKLPCQKFKAEFNRRLSPARTVIAAEHRPEVLPNDLHKTAEWGLYGPFTKRRRELYGANVIQAWNTITGSSEPHLVVAVVDTGCSMHPDLESNLCKPGEDCEGYDFGDKDSNPFDEPLEKIHGTPVSGIIGAMPNNNYGLAGICWGCKIMCLKVHSSRRNAIGLDSVLESYNYIVQKKVKLSNHSYISFGYSRAEESAITTLERAGHLLVVAAGNFGCNIDATETYLSNQKCVGKRGFAGLAAPAGYDNDNIISVGSIDRNGRRSSFSNYGAEKVDLFAPGSSIPALINTAKYDGSVGTVAGTSFACPFVAGTAALMWSRKPTLTFREIKNAIMSTARPIEHLRGLSVTGGILDTFAAVQHVGGGTDKPHEARPRPVVDNTGSFYGGAVSLVTAGRAKEKAAAGGIGGIVLRLMTLWLLLKSIV